MQKTFFESAGKCLAYLAGGEGPKRLVFTHGLCGNKSVWHKQIEFFRKTHEILSIDCLGHGESSPVDPASFIPSNVSLVRDWLAALPPKPSTLIGHSFGGLILHELSGSLPERTSLVFVDSPCLYSPKRLAEYQEWELEILKSQDRKAMIADWFGGFVTKTCSPEDRAEIVGETLKFEPEWIAKVMRKIAAPRNKPSDARVLVIEGLQFFPDGNDLSWKHLYPDAEDWKCPGEGHFYFLEAPGPFNQRLLEFVR